MRLPTTWIRCALLLPIVGARVALAADDKVAEPPAMGDVAAWVDGRVAALAPKESEKRFDEIGWSTEIVAAERLAKERRRPLFLFTHDGRMNEGRC